MSSLIHWDTYQLYHVHIMDTVLLMIASDHYSVQKHHANGDLQYSEPCGIITLIVLYVFIVFQLWCFYGLYIQTIFFNSTKYKKKIFSDNQPSQKENPSIFVCNAHTIWHIYFQLKLSPRHCIDDMIELLCKVVSTIMLQWWTWPHAFMSS